MPRAVTVQLLIAIMGTVSRFSAVQVAAPFLAVLAVYTSEAQSPQDFQDLRLVTFSASCNARPDDYRSCLSVDVSRFVADPSHYRCG
jgi:hypothetical protein